MSSNQRTNFEDVWDLYQRTGFMYPQKEAGLKPYLEDIKRTWTHLLKAENGIFQYICRSREGKQTASIAIAQYSGHSWLMEHAVGFRDTKGVRDNLIDMAEWVQEKPECNFLLFRYRQANKWPNMVFSGLMESLTDNAYRLQVYDYYTGSFENPLALETRDGLSIQYATSETIAEFSRDVEPWRGALEMSSKGLYPHEAFVPEASANFEVAGLFRHRDILVARQDGRIVGYSLLDYSSIGISFSFFFNTFCVVMKEQDFFVEKQLVAMSINHYVENGRAFVIGMRETGTGEALVAHGMSYGRQYTELTLTRDNDGFAQSVPYWKSLYERATRFYQASGSGAK